MVHKGSVRKLLGNIVFNYFAFFTIASSGYLLITPILNIVDIIISFQWNDCNLENHYVGGLKGIGITGIVLYSLLHISQNTENPSETNNQSNSQCVTFLTTLYLIYAIIVFIMSSSFSIILLDRGIHIEDCNSDQFYYLYTRYLLIGFSILYLIFVSIAVPLLQYNTTVNNPQPQIPNLRLDRQAIEI